MNRCETCKHWGEHSTVMGEYEMARDRVLPVRHCEAIPHLWDATQWSADGERREIVPKYLRTLAFASDGSEYAADVYTKAEFGCAMHEPRNEIT